MNKLILAAALLLPQIGQAVTLNQYLKPVHATLNQQLVDGDVANFGDSITQRWKPQEGKKAPVNFAVGGSMSSDVIAKIDDTTNLCKAGNVQLLVGINDIAHGKYHQLITNLPILAAKLGCAKVTWIGILHPTRSDFTSDKHTFITKANGQIKKFCGAMPNCTYVPPPQMIDSDYGDKLHPNASGYGKMKYLVDKYTGAR